MLHPRLPTTQLCSTARLPPAPPPEPPLSWPINHAAAMMLDSPASRLHPPPPPPPRLPFRHHPMSSSGVDEVDGLVETRLEGRPILAFDIGGEKRLCLPQVLHRVLLAAGLSLEAISRACDHLRILCRRCDRRQMAALHLQRVFGPGLENCGLVSQSDAERLCKLLLAGRAPLLTEPALRGSQEPLINVRHSCFGKQRGVLVPRLYSGPEAPCVACTTCRCLYSPQQFVGHTHGPTEIATCHWGFESVKWRLYLMPDWRHRGRPTVGDDQDVDAEADDERRRERLEAALEAVKARFAADVVTAAGTSDLWGPETHVQSHLQCLNQSSSTKRARQCDDQARPTTSDWRLQRLPQQRRSNKTKFGSSHYNSSHAFYSRNRGRKKQPQEHQPPVSQLARSQSEFAPKVCLQQLPPPRPSPPPLPPPLPPPSPPPSPEEAIGHVREEEQAAEAAAEAALQSDWEALTDWTEGHLPEKATPQFLAMVDRVKTGYAARIAGLRRLVAATRMQLLELRENRRRRDQQQLVLVQMQAKYLARKADIRAMSAEVRRLRAALAEASESGGSHN